MRKKAINKAIAEILGRKYHEPTEDEIASGSYYQYEPDFTSDLNAMQSAVLSQDENFIKMFSTALSYRSSRTGKVFCRMTPADWAEEFLEVKRVQAETTRHDKT